MHAHRCAKPDKKFIPHSQSKDSFYGEVERTRMPLAQRLKNTECLIAGGAM
jgi:hypothetical protein